jgi:hypothetical protein
MNQLGVHGGQRHRAAAKRTAVRFGRNWCH